MDKPYYNAIDYHTLDKNQCVDLGWTIAKQFLELNGLAIPHFTKYDHRASGSYCGMCTYYRNTRTTKVQVWEWCATRLDTMWTFCYVQVNPPYFATGVKRLVITSHVRRKRLPKPCVSLYLIRACCTY